GIAGNRERLVHDIRAMVADCSRGQLDPVADDVVLVSEDLEGIQTFERVEPALRHRKRVVAELDLPGIFVPFVHRKIGHPAELEDTLPGEAELAPDPEPRGAGEGCKALWHAAHKKNRIAVSEPQLAAQLDGRRRAEASCDRPG